MSSSNSFTNIWPTANIYLIGGLLLLITSFSVTWHTVKSNEHINIQGSTQWYYLLVTRLSTRSICLSTRSTRSHICPSFHNWSLKWQVSDLATTTFCHASDWKLRFHLRSILKRLKNMKTFIERIWKWARLKQININ